MARLPSGYQEVEYISSSGTQYINTDIKLNQSHIIELKLNINSNLNQWDKFYGGGDDGSMLFAQYEKTGTTNQNKIKITNKSGDSMYSNNAITPGYDHIFIHSNTEFYIDGVLQSSTTATTFTMNTGLNIFAMGNSQSTGREKSSYKLYYMKIFNSNNSLDYCFIPCYRKSDDEIGLYDIINDVFYTNSGTGTFTKGPEPATTGKIKRIRIGENLARPLKVVKCDFTQSYNGFTYLGSSRSNAASQGRDSTHGLYITYNSTANIQGYFSVPNTITSQGDIYKIEFYCYSTAVQNGAGFVSNATSNYKEYPVTYVRFWYNGIDIYNNNAGTGTVVVDMPSGGYVATVDLDNLQCYTSNNPTGIATIPSAYAEVYKTLWHSGNFCIVLCKGGQSGTVYLEKVKFYVR